MFNYIKEVSKRYGAFASEIICVSELDLSLYESVVASYPENLNYLKKIEIRKNIKNFFPQAKSVLLCLYQYWNSKMNYDSFKIEDVALHLKKTGRKIPVFIKDRVLDGNKISRYALSYDYHIVLRKKLAQTLQEIKKKFPEINGKIFVDSSPVVEKYLVKVAGLGWQGKNTLIINKDSGSYFFIGGIALNIQCEEKNIFPQKDLCGSCNKCLQACPTGALSEYKLNPIKCISYWTTHNKSKFIPEEILKNNAFYVYGCDICQEVCPYNSKVITQVDKDLLPKIDA